MTQCALMISCWLLRVAISTPSLHPFAAKRNVIMSPSKDWNKDRLGDLMICEVQRLPWNVRASLISPVSPAGSPFSVGLLCEEAPGTQEDWLNSVVELTCGHLIHPHSRKAGLRPKVARHGEGSASFHGAVTK